MVRLSNYDNGAYFPGRSRLWQALWFFLGLPLLRSAFIPSSSFRAALLRFFGAHIGQQPTIKPGFRVKYPWLFTAGDHCWLGEDAWIDNLAPVSLGDNVCISQGAYLCTGNHDWQDPAFRFSAQPITLGDGSWVGARATVAPGVSFGALAIASLGSVVMRDIPPGEIHSGNPAAFRKLRQMRHPQTEVERNTTRALGRLPSQDNMKILLVNQFFWPDSAATSQFLTDLARELSERGHQVEVLCGGGRVYAQQDESGRPNVSIRRSLSMPFGRSKPMRLLSYASFLATAGLLGLFGGKPDLIITLTTPPLVSLVGTLIKFARGVRHISWEMDLYPDVICDLGYFKPENPIIRAIGSLADFSRRYADGIIALGDCMKRRLVARGVAPEKIHVSENWADGKLITPEPFRPVDPLTILYSGNLGLGHDVETIADTMFALKEDPRFRFVFAGGGGRREAIEAFCSDNQIESALFRSYCRREDLGSSLAEGHIGLVTQNSKCSGSIVPSKVYGILAAGRPLLYIGPADSTPAHLIQRFGCGWQIDCGDSESLRKLLQHLADNPSEVYQAGAAARAAFDAHYERGMGLAHLCSLLFNEQPAVEPHHIPVAALSISGPITDSKL